MLKILNKMGEILIMALPINGLLWILRQDTFLFYLIFVSMITAPVLLSQRDVVKTKWNNEFENFAKIPHKYM